MDRSSDKRIYLNIDVPSTIPYSRSDKSYTTGEPVRSPIFRDGTLKPELSKYCQMCKNMIPDRANQLNAFDYSEKISKIIKDNGDLIEENRELKLQLETYKKLADKLVLRNFMDNPVKAEEKLKLEHRKETHLNHYNYSSYNETVKEDSLTEQSNHVSKAKKSKSSNKKMGTSKRTPLNYSNTSQLYSTNPTEFSDSYTLIGSMKNTSYFSDNDRYSPMAIGFTSPVDNAKTHRLLDEIDQAINTEKNQRKSREDQRKKLFTNTPDNKASKNTINFVVHDI